MAANVDIEIAEHEGVVVPSQAVLDVEIDDFPGRLASDPLINRAKRTSQAVYRVVDNEAFLVPVKVGPSNLSDTIISRGIEVGDEVVIGPYKALEKLRDGSKVSLEEISVDDISEPGGVRSDEIVESNSDESSESVGADSSAANPSQSEASAGSA